MISFYKTEDYLYMLKHLKMRWTNTKFRTVVSSEREEKGKIKVDKEDTGRLLVLLSCYELDGRFRGENKLV